MISKVFKTNTFGLFILLLLIIVSCGENDKDYNFTVKGKLDNIDSPYFYITFDAADTLVIDTVFLDSKGEFNYKGNIDKLTMASLFFNKKSCSTSLFINKGWNVELEGDVNRPDLIIVKGGDVNNDLTTFKKANEILFTSKADLLQMIDDESANPETVQNYITELKNVNFELTNKARAYIENNPGKIASVILIQDFYKNNISIEMLDQLLDLLTDEASKYPLIKELKEYSDAVKQSEVGKKAPDFTLTFKGKSKNLESLKGKYIFLTFGVDNLELYTHEISVLMKLYPELKKKNVEFISVILDVNHNPVIPDSIKWDVFYDYKGWASNIVKDYNIISVPYGILISPDGYILERDLKSVALSDKIDEIRKK